MSEQGSFNNRFKIVYQASVLGNINSEFNGNRIIAYKKGESIQLDAGNVTIEKLELLDSSGRLIYAGDKVNANRTVISELKVKNQMLILKITSTENSIIIKKRVYLYT